MANKLHEIVFRTYKIPKELRQKIKERRDAQGQTLQEFIHHSVAKELQDLVAAINRELPMMSSKDAQPARLPLTSDLLDTLQEANEATDIPVNRLLLVCFLRTVSRKRRRKASGNK